MMEMTEDQVYKDLRETLDLVDPVGLLDPLDTQ